MSLPFVKFRGRRGRRQLPVSRVVRRVTHANLSLPLVSVAGLVGRPVRNQSGAEVGRVDDIVIRWEGASHPSVSGVVVKVGRRRAFLHARSVERIDAAGALLRSATLDLRDFVPRPGEVALARHVLDHQLVDVDGVRVVRASDLYLADVAGALRLVGVDVGVQTLVRRLGPARWRTIPTPTRVIDWATIQPLSSPGASVRLSNANKGLRRLRPAELADLLEDLGRAQRQDLISALAPDQAAEALEEMNDDDREAILRDAPAAEAALLVAEMAPDEAAEVLRELDDDERDEILHALPTESMEELSLLLSFPDGSAGAAMTTILVVAHAGDTVDGASRMLAAMAADRGDIDGVLVVDDDGRLVDDLSLFELVTAEPGTILGALVAEPYPVTVEAEDELETVVQRFIDNRGSSIVVVDADRRPIGRILADDVIDALLDSGRFSRARRVTP